MKSTKLKILMGLPGSGKTTFAKEYAKNNNKSSVIHVDNIRNSYLYMWDKPLSEVIRYGSSYIPRTCNNLVIDGLILTNKDIADAIIAATEYFNITDIEIHHWDEDRETCLKNDGGRREVSSATTILNAPYEEVDINKINSEMKKYEIEDIKIINHKVQLKPDWIRYTKPYAIIDDDGKLRSGSWCTGGSYGNCWDSHLSPVSPEAPCEFTALDELLEGICPNISFLHYKKIMKECVETEETYESDYYGGGTNHMNYVCDLEKMYKIIKELGYLE